MRQRNKDRLRSPFWVTVVTFVGIGALAAGLGGFLGAVDSSWPEGQIPGAILGTVCSGISLFGLVVAWQWKVVRTVDGVAVGELSYRLKRFTRRDVRAVGVAEHVNGIGLVSLCPALVLEPDGDVYTVTVLAAYVPFGWGRSRIDRRAKTIANWLEVPFIDTPADAQ